METLFGVHAQVSLFFHFGFASLKKRRSWATSRLWIVWLETGLPNERSFVACFQHTAIGFPTQALKHELELRRAANCKGLEFDSTFSSIPRFADAGNKSGSDVILSLVTCGMFFNRGGGGYFLLA